MEKQKKIMDPMRFELMHLTILDLESSALNRSAKDPFVIFIVFTDLQSLLGIVCTHSRVIPFLYQTHLFGNFRASCWDAMSLHRAEAKKILMRGNKTLSLLKATGKQRILNARIEVDMVSLIILDIKRW